MIDLLNHNKEGLHMYQCIESVINGMLEKLKAYGLSDSTVNQYNRGFCKRIAEYCHDHGGGYYSETLLDDFLAAVKKQLEDGEIQMRHYNATKRTIRCLKEYAENGEVDFSMHIDRRIYNPDNGHLELIKQILGETGLQEGFQYKINCCMRHFFVFIESLGLQNSEITDETIRAFISKVSNTNAGSMDYIIYAVNLIAGYFRGNSLANVQEDFHCFMPKPAPVRLIAPYSQEESRRILNGIVLESISAKRDRAIILLTFNTGFRGIDIRNLLLSDINWKKGEVQIIQSKTKRPVTLPLSGTSMNALADYILEERPKTPEQTVFLRAISPHTSFHGTSALDGIIEGLCLKAGVNKKPYRSFHSLRRSLATELSLAEVPLTSVSQMLGHQSIDSDVPYLSFNRVQTALCAIGFNEIPITSGIYAGLDGYGHISADEGVPWIVLKMYGLVAMGFEDIPIKGGVFA